MVVPNSPSLPDINPDPVAISIPASVFVIGVDVEVVRDADFGVGSDER